VTFSDFGFVASFRRYSRSKSEVGTKLTEISHVFGPKFFGGSAPEFLDLYFKADIGSDHVAKFRGDRPRNLGERVEKKTSLIHLQNIRPPELPYGRPNMTKPVYLSGPAFTFIHVHISRDLSIRFIFSLVRIPHAQNILSTYACDAEAANNSWATGESLLRRPASSARSRITRQRRSLIRHGIYTGTGSVVIMALNKPKRLGFREILMFNNYYVGDIYSFASWQNRLFGFFFDPSSGKRGRTHIVLG